MNKDVIVTISGYQSVNQFPREKDQEEISLIASGNYYFKDGKHYIFYDELVEGMPGSIKNKVKISDGVRLEIIKTGLTNSHMVFERERIHVSPYETPYGEILIGTYTRRLDINTREDSIDVYVKYDMDLQHENYAECDIRMSIKEKSMKME